MARGCRSPSAWCATCRVPKSASMRPTPHFNRTRGGSSAPHPDEIRDDQGIGRRNPDTGAFIYYNLAGAYDSNIALVVTHGGSRHDNLARLCEILRTTELRGDDLQTNMPVLYGLLCW